MKEELLKAIKNLEEITDLVKEEIQNNDENTTAILNIVDLKSLDIILKFISEFSKETDDSHFAIIENTNEARKEFGLYYGVNDLIISKGDIKALITGECLAYTDGEYSTFITLS